MVQLSYPYMTTGKTIILTIQTFSWVHRKCSIHIYWMNEWTHPYLTTASIYCIVRYKLRNILFCSEPFNGFSLSLYKMKMLYDNLSLWSLSAHFHRPNSFPFQDLCGCQAFCLEWFFPQSFRSTIWLYPMALLHINILSVSPAGIMPCDTTTCHHVSSPSTWNPVNVQLIFAE